MATKESIDSDSSLNQDAEPRSNKPLKMRVVLSMIRRKFSIARQMSTSELQSLVESGKPYILLDNRAQEEYDISKIEGAHWVDPEATNVTDLVKGVLENMPEDTTIVCYCSIGYRSSQVVELIMNDPNMKAREVFNLEGSIFQWANEDRPVVNKHEELTTLVHPYSFIWGKLLKPEKRFT